MESKPRIGTHSSLSIGVARVMRQNVSPGIECAPAASKRQYANTLRVKTERTLEVRQSLNQDEEHPGNFAAKQSKHNRQHSLAFVVNDPYP